MNYIDTFIEVADDCPAQTASIPAHKGGKRTVLVLQYERSREMTHRTATSAGAIILREVEGLLKVALAHHVRADRPWVLPKGHVEEGESLEQAALREVYEETGLAHVQLLKHLGTIVRESVKSNGDVEEKTIHFYLAYALGEGQVGAQFIAPAPSDERFVGVGWFLPEEVLGLLPYESDRVFLREQLGLLFKS